MAMMKRNMVLAVAVAAAVAAPSAFATYGYFSHGYGMKAKGMAGAVTASAQDTFGGANNPASMVWVGNRLDVGLDWFSPIRSAERSGSSNGINGSAASDSENFFIPEFGYNSMINPNMSLGVTIYGNGGMNTNYKSDTITSPGGTALCEFFNSGSFVPTQSGYNILCGKTKLGVDLAQLVIAPTFSYKINSTNSIGISPLLGYQRFKAEGLQGFASLSRDSGNLTNNGYDSSTGFGVRVGWFGKISNDVTLGFAYSSKINMGKFDKYKGLFAEQGDFDMPANWNAGVAFKVTPKATVTLDYQKIEYSGVKAVSNPSSNALTSAKLGDNGGAGFGWKDVKVWKLGYEHQFSSKTTFRAGYGRTDNPIGSSDVTFNILAPGVVQNHITLGFTQILDKSSELSMAYMHATENKVSGASLFTSLGAGPSGTEEIKMHQNSLGIAWSNKW